MTSSKPNEPRWIARRRLRWLRGAAVTVAIGAPEPVSPEEWRCPYRISGLGRRPVQHAHGVDALQSLMNAILGLRRELEPFRADLVWDGAAEKGDFGIPMSVPGAFGLDFTLRMEGLIEREIDRIGKAAVRTRARRWRPAASGGAPVPKGRK